MKLPANKLTYHATLDGYGDKELMPLGENSLVMSYELSDEDDNPLYKYNIKFAGSLTFSGEDFDWIYGAETAGFRCSDMVIEIKSNGCGEGFEDIMPGTKVKLSDGEWDLDKCQVSLPVVSPDPYECINERKVDTLNMLDVGDPDTVRLYDYSPTFEYVVANENVTLFAISDNKFQHFPNKRVEYPGFGSEGEEVEPFGPYLAATKLFNSEDLRLLARDPTHYQEILGCGDIPIHPDFAYSGGAWDALAVGWRLYYVRYEIFNNILTPNTMGFKGRWRWVREVKYVAPGTPMGSDWVFIETIFSLDRYVRAPILVPRKRKYLPSKMSTTFANEAEIKFYYSNYIVGEVTNIVDPDDEGNAATGDENIYGITEVPNGRRLNNLIEHSIAHCCPDLEVVSDFFQINPETVSADNYVTGETSFVNEIMIFQKSDVKRPWASEHATIGSYTTEELLKWLWNEFKVKYTIFGSTFRLEHYKSDVFRQAPEISLIVPPYNAMLAGTRKYTYDIKRLPAKEMFEFMEARKQVATATDDDFAGLPILYDGNCVNRTEKQNVISRPLNRVTNDVIFILVNSGGAETRVTDNETSNSYKVTTDVKKGVISDDGFSMVATRIDAGVRYGITLPSILGTRDVFNNVMGWAHLHDKFYRDLANAESGTMNGAAIVFNSTKYVKKQTRLPFTLCCIVDFNPFAKITSELGTGIIKNAEWSPVTNVMRVELLFQL